MKTAFKSSFAKDLKSIKDKLLHERVRRLISAVEAARDLQGIPEIKKLQAKGNYYRIKLGEYRVGVILKGEELTFVRCLHRREIYRYFP